MNAGDLIPDFTATDQHGNTVSLSELVADGPVVLFFYPKAMTTGCTAESCHFRDLKADFAAVGARPVGISFDSAEKQKEFDDKNDLGFTLLADTDKTIGKIFGAKRPLIPVPKRQTFVINADRTLRLAISSEMNMERHADEALAALS